MKAARIHGPRDIRIADEPEPVPGPGYDRVRVTAVGLCGSDLHWYAEAAIGDARVQRPLVLGHEMAGVIEGGDRHGLRVAIDPAIPCGACELCRSGHRNLCPRIGFAGHGDIDGGLREVLTWPSELLIPLPDTLSDVEGAVLEPLGVALHALDLGQVQLGSSAAVVGCGPIGLLLLQLARLAGASTVIAVEPLAHRRSAAERAGADIVVDPADGVAETTSSGGLGADVVFEACGADEAVDVSLRLARPGGRLVLVGIPDGDRTSFRASTARRKGLTMIMSRRMNDVYPRAIQLAVSGRVDLASVVTTEHPLTDAGTAFDEASRRTGLKVVIRPSTR